MKFHIEIDATPEEMRRFLGLPDMTPLHEAWIERMKQLSTEGLGPEEWQKMTALWMSSVSNLPNAGPMQSMTGVSDSLDAWQKLMNAGFAAATGAGKYSKGE